ncbi:hypothetical protein BDR26DRAFT_696832 [Obelidium mucronatum]|nr:hypothetical protein BDR26DRAFT_696832 [Obelidium mucronatum]
MSTIRNLASSDENKTIIIKEGAIYRIGELLRLEDDVLSESVKNEMTACLAVLALVEGAKAQILKLLKYLIRLCLSSQDGDITSNSAFTIGNCVVDLNERETQMFLHHWQNFRKYIAKFISSSDTSLRHIAVWTLVQCISGNEKVREKLSDDKELLRLIEAVSNKTLPNSREVAATSSGLIVENSVEELSQTLLHELQSPRE